MKNYAKFRNKYLFTLDIYLFLLVVYTVSARCIKLLSKESGMDKCTLSYELRYCQATKCDFYCIIEICNIGLKGSTSYKAGAVEELGPI
jgi:hypothetical protein